MCPPLRPRTSRPGTFSVRPRGDHDMSSTRSIARRAAALGASISLVALGVLAASPAQAATCTVTPTTWPDLQAAFATAPASGGGDLPRRGHHHLRGLRRRPAHLSAGPMDLRPQRSLPHHRGLASSGNVAVIDVSRKTLTIDATGGGSLSVYTERARSDRRSQGEGAGTIIINGGTSTPRPDTTDRHRWRAIRVRHGSVTINGGDVTASTTNCGAGIGSGDNATVRADVTSTAATSRRPGRAVPPASAAPRHGGRGESSPSPEATSSHVDAGAGIGGGRNGAGPTSPSPGRRHRLGRPQRRVHGAARRSERSGPAAPPGL